MKLDTAPPRGMKDVLPPEVELRDRASATILATYKRYGFRRIETPALESLRLLLGSEPVFGGNPDFQQKFWPSRIGGHLHPG